MSDDFVRYEVSNHIARITLARPPVNALSLKMIEAVVGALRQAAADESARAVVLASAVPKVFCAGLDLKALHGMPMEDVRTLLQALYVQLHDAQYGLGKPSIAAIAGAARVHYSHLPRIIGRHRAFELLFSGRSFDSEEAYRLGLLSRVVPDGEAEPAALKLAETFAAKSPAVMRLGRAAFMRQNDLDYRRSIASAAEDFCNVSMTEAAQEGLQAFLDKRPHRS
jgi:enoyl-CoA hydratase